MHRLSSLALASVFSVQVLAASLSSRNSPPAPPGWEYFLCFEDNRPSGEPLFIGASYTDSTGMTVENCANFCDSQPVSYRFMGITDGSLCSCDNFFEYIFESEPDNECETPCPGDPSEAGFCGGMDGYTPTASTYQKINSTFVIPALVPSTGLWNGLGCYNDSVSARALQVSVNAGNTTVESCVAACQAQKYTLAGLENGGECWCGSQLENGSKFYGNNNGIDTGAPFHRYDPNGLYCNMGCEGNPNELCGGPALLDLYNFTGTYPIGASVVPSSGFWNSVGCYSDSSSRTLERAVNAGNVTVESCVSACQSQMFTIAGLEYAQECWCGNEINSPGAPISQSACKQACIGNNAEICGGPDALQMYNFTGTYPIGASVVPSVGAWTSVGCYSDSSSRTLERAVNAGNVTVESCVSACQSQSFSIAGLEYAQECWCGNNINSPGAPTSQSACNQACIGNNAEVCGGPDALQMYKFTGTYPIGASVVPSVGTWISSGCYSDSSSRTLERAVNAGNVTVESCVSACQSQSFSIAGLEYAQECWCGNNITSPGAPISQSACNQACIGNNTEVCGGPDALQMYFSENYGLRPGDGPARRHNV